MRLFWERGYESTSIADLTRVLGIGPPSLYAAFGDKESLFKEAVDFYVRTYGAYLAEALTQEPTAYRAVARALHEAARELTSDNRPRGCLVVFGASNVTAQSTGVERELLRHRRSFEEAFAARIAQGGEEGDVPRCTDTRALARFTSCVFQGMSQQARDGASQHDLEKVAESAMMAWPSNDHAPAPGVRGAGCPAVDHASAPDQRE